MHAYADKTQYVGSVRDNKERQEGEMEELGKSPGVDFHTEGEAPLSWLLHVCTFEDIWEACCFCWI